MNENNTNTIGGSVRKFLTNLISLNGKIRAYGRLTERQRKTVASSVAQSWVLSMLNPEKQDETEKLPQRPVSPLTAKRLEELRFLHNNNLITDDEYVEKRADILRRL